MKKQETSQLTEGFKISKNSSVIPSTTRDLNKAVEILKTGGVIIFPSDTVYGIGCRYDSEVGIARIRRIKGSTQDFPVLVASFKQAYDLAKFNTSAIHLANKYWPGGLTLIVPEKNGTNNIALRIADSEIVKVLIEKSGFPIIGTSANYHGQPSPGSSEQIDKSFATKADFIIKGTCKFKQQSTVIDATGDVPRIIREGAVEVRQ